MNEELLKIIEAMEAANEPAESIAAVVQQYMAEQGMDTVDTPAADVMSVSQRDIDAGIKPESYVNDTAWSTSGLDRSTYYDEQGNLITTDAEGNELNPLTDIGYSLALDDEQVRENLIKDSEAPEELESEGLFDVSRDQNQDAIDKANATTDSYIALNQPYDNSNLYYNRQEFVGQDGSTTEITQTVVQPGGQEVTTKIDKDLNYLYVGLDEVVPGETPLQREERFMETWKRQGRLMQEGKIPAPKAFSSSTSTLTPESYANWRLEKARDKNDKLYDPFLASNTYDKFNEATDFSKLYEVEKTIIAAKRLSDKTGEQVNFIPGQSKVSDFPGLQEMIDTVSNDDPELRELIAKGEARQNRSNQIIAQATDIAEELGDEHLMQPSDQVGDMLFGKPEKQEEMAEQAKQDLETLTGDIKDKSVQYNMISERYSAINDRLTEVSKELEKEEYKDPKGQIDIIKAKYDLNTREGIEAANKEIKEFIGRYSNLIEEYNTLRPAVQDTANALLRLEGEIGELGVREADLNAFTNTISQNHRTGTKIAMAFTNATIDLAQGAADFVYLVNPLGALADELVDFYDDPTLGVVVEAARQVTGFATGGITLYSGERREAIRDSIDGFQQHMSSQVGQAVMYDDIETFGDAVEFALVAGASQVPQLALLAATGGLSGIYVMGALSAGQKFNDMEAQKALYERTGGMFGQDHSFAAMYSASIASGFVEAMSEKVTLGLLKGTGGVITSKVFKETGSRAAANMLRRRVFTPQALKYSAKKIVDVAEEGVSEVFATMGGNYIDRISGDKTVSIFDGVEESFVTGALIGATLTAPHIFNDAYSAFKSVESAQAIAENFDRIKVNQDIINDPQSTQEAVDAALENIRELTAQNSEFIALDLKRVDSLTDEQKRVLFEIEKSQRNMERRFSEVMASDMTKEQKDKISDEMNIGWNKNLARKNQILKSVPTDEVLKNHENEIKRIEEESARSVAEGGPAINVTRANGKNNEDIANQFEEWKNNAKKRGNVKIAASENGTQVYGAMVPILDANGDVISYEMFFNDKNIYEDGVTTTGSHELLHAAVFNTIRANPALRNRFGDAINRILEGPGVKISKKAQEKLDVLSQYSKEQRGEELFAIVSELMVSGDITIDGGAVGRFKDLLRRTSMQTTDTDIVFNNDADVRNFLKDYSRSRKKGIADKRITSLFSNKAKGKLVETPVSRDEARRVVEGRFEEALQEGYMSTLSASLRANPDMRQEFDSIVKNEDGTPKFATNAQFLSEGSAEAYLKIVESPILDRLIQQGMTERGLPPAALRDFTRKVKEKLGERLLTNYDVTKNDSLFGWLTGVSGGAGKSIIYRAKGDVMNEYKKDGELETVSMDAPIGETTTFEATIEAETDAFMQQLEEADLTARESDIVGPQRFVDTINLDQTSIDQINTTVESADLDIQGLTYKGVKKLTTGQDAALSSILDIVAKQFGVSSSNVIKSSNLNSKQRAAAQEFIKNNAQALIDMLPEGETNSGESTGVARVLLNNFYKKGERLKFAAGATAAGKFAQLKRSDITTQEFLEAFGMRPDGTFDNNRKYDGAINGLINQAAMITANQAIRDNAVRKGTHPMSTIALLGNGRSEAMFSKRLRQEATKNPELGVFIIDQLRNASNELYAKSGRNTKAVLQNIFAEELKNKTISQSLINQLAKDINRVGERFSNRTDQDIILKDKSLGEIIVDQIEHEAETERQYYRTIVAKKTGKTDLQQVTDPEYASLFRTNTLNRMSKDLGADFVMRFLAPGISAPSKTGKGEFVFTGLNTYERNPNYDPKSTNRKGVTEGAADTAMVLEGQDVDTAPQPSIATKGNLTFDDINSKVKPNLERVVKFQQENNQAFRDVVGWLKTNYENGNISESEVVTMLELMNANPKGLTRSAAVLGFLPVDAFDGPATLEHMTPALTVNFYALNYILSGNNAQSAKDFTDVMDNYRVTYLPKKYDNLVNKYYKSNMPRYWNPSLSSLLRYYNPETYGFFDLKLQDIATGDVIGQEMSIDIQAYERANRNARKALTMFADPSASDSQIKEVTNDLVELMASKRPTQNKGASIWDFDDTLATTKSKILYKTPDGTEGSLNAEEYARDYVELAAQGYEFDFSEFNKVVGGKPGPLFNKALERAKKFGTKDTFILTARAPQAQEAIFEFLKGVGLEIPAENIVGLGNSTGQAKAMWIANNLIKEGYNDLYFADDALQNVQAVKVMFDQFDVKGKVQQAKVEFSKRAPKQMDGIIDEGTADLDSDFNIILEQTKGVARFKQFSAGKARQRGKNKGRFKFFIPPSADDFAGLLYSFMGKGEIGNKHHAFFKKHLFDPFSKGIRLLNRVNQIAANDLKNLRKSFPDVRKRLKDKLPGLEYTTEDAIRVYNWNKQGFDVPGLSQTDLNAIVKAVEGNASLKAFADGVSRISVGEAIMPDDSWLGGTIASDINDSLENARSTYLQEWIDNKNAIFTEANMNKIEAVYGSNFREALEDVLFRMENGGNRSQGQGRLMNTFTNWIHGSIGTTMFFNARSAMLQMISNVNFINWSDNNMLKAAAAFANQKQYWSDVAMIFNSDFLKQRRGRIQTDVNAAELLAEIRDSKNPMKKATAYLLQLGFTPTQIADSFAIATGGATFYRNRVDSYIKEGMSKKDAETKAFEDMMEIAEETQQSTREDRISQQQASPLGKFILAFQNTPMQYNRLIKKAAQDLVNGRGNATANVSKIVYYGAIQNMIFYGLQQALFAAMFGDDEEDKIDDKQKERMINGMLDTVLRGSGIGGAVVSTTKNVILKFMEQEEKAKDDKFFTEPDHAYTIIEALNISPPIGIKARKLYSALQSWEFNREVIDYMDKTDIDNPIYDAVFSATEAVTNLPLSRLYSKYQNLKEAANSDHETWKRVAMLLGWSKWSFGIKNQDVMSAKNEIKEIKAEEREERQEQKKLERQIAKDEEERQVVEDNKLDQDEKREEGDAEVQCAAVSGSGKRCSNMALDGKSFCTVHDEVPQQENEVQCSHTKSNGERCKMKTKNKSGKCYYHD